MLTVGDLWLLAIALWLSFALILVGACAVQAHSNHRARRGRAAARRMRT